MKRRRRRPGESDPRWRLVPIILLTALAGSETTLEAYAQGADDFGDRT